MAEYDLPAGPAELFEAVRDTLGEYLGGQHHMRLGGGTALAAQVGAPPQHGCRSLHRGYALPAPFRATRRVPTRCRRPPRRFCRCDRGRTCRALHSPARSHWGDHPRHHPIAHASPSLRRHGPRHACAAGNQRRDPREEVALPHGLARTVRAPGPLRHRGRARTGSRCAYPGARSHRCVPSSRDVHATWSLSLTAGWRTTGSN